MELTVITGMSGAGKSQAIGAFEDAGWFCVDNLPPGLLPALAELFLLEGAKMERAAVVCDVRGGVWFRELQPVLDRLASQGARPRLMFLEASDETLLNRFRETRRPHPLGEGGAILAGIERERVELAGVRERADVVVDSTGLTIWELRRAVADTLRRPGDRARLQVAFVSFGYKHGIPRDADLLFDVRFLPNPHYEPELAPLTGLDEPVAAFLREARGMSEFWSRLTDLLDFLLPAYADEGKNSVAIGIGCTGGRHRSVALAEALAARYRDAGGERDAGDAGLALDVTVSHRHVTRPHAPPTLAARVPGGPPLASDPPHLAEPAA